MKTFTRYLDAWAFCRAHGLSMAAIQKTGQWEYTVFVDDVFIIGNNGKAMPQRGA